MARVLELQLSAGGAAVLDLASKEKENSVDFRAKILRSIFLSG
jgi:hypothetical protein